MYYSIFSLITKFRINWLTIFKVVRIGEGFAPELVTVQPQTRGTGNHQGQTVSSGRGMGGGAGQSKEIHIHLNVDGREFKKVVTKIALEDFGLQV